MCVCALMRLYAHIPTESLVPSRQQILWSCNCSWLIWKNSNGSYSLRQLLSPYTLLLKKSIPDNPVNG